MAKVTVTIEDTFNGKVSIKSDPNFETLMKMDMSGEELTSAHGYAFSILRHAVKIGKGNSPIIREIPRVIKPY